jgi:hypothetical protein
MKTLLRLSALTLGLALASTVSYADTVSMTFNSVGGANNGTDYIYPYYFNINGSSTLTSLMCVSYDNEVWQGESWTATVAPITTTSAVAAQKDAYLFSLLGDSTYTTNDIQEAIWELSAANPSSVPTTSIDPTLLSDAATAVSAADEGGSATFDDGQYLLYPANAGSQNPSTDGTPQNYIGVSPVPEPGSIFLLATGLLGFAVFYRRRPLTI